MGSIAAADPAVTLAQLRTPALAGLQGDNIFAACRSTCPRVALCARAAKAVFLQACMEAHLSQWPVLLT